jgi:hypothetical protein
MDLKRLALKSMIVSAVATAAIGVLVVLFGQFNWFGLRILLTTFVVSATSLAILANAAYAAKHSMNAVSGSGAIFSILAGALILFGLWVEVNEDAYWKLTASTSVAAIGFSHFALLSLAALASRFAWVRVLAGLLIASLAGLLLIAIWGEGGGDEVLRLIAAAAILVALISILTPVFHKLSSSEPADRPRPISRMVEITCPDCAAPMTVWLGESRCSSCGCQFNLTIVSNGSAPVRALS